MFNKFKKELEGDAPEFKTIKNFRKYKIRTIIIYQDLSFTEHFEPFNDGYRIVLKDMAYIVVPRCIIRGKFPTLVYFFNNPFPIDFSYKPCRIKNTDMIKKGMKTTTDIEVSFDAKIIQSMMDSSVVSKLYDEKRVNVKQVLIIAGVSFVALLIILHLFGVIDIAEMVTDLFGAMGKKG